MTDEWLDDDFYARHRRRNREIVRLRGTGMTYKAIGAVFGISGNRVMQIMQRVARRNGGDYYDEYVPKDKEMYERIRGKKL